MSSRTPAVLCWSGGKDSTLALRALKDDPRTDVALLLATATEGYERISMHGVRIALVERQAAALEVPLRWVRIPVDCAAEEYAARMKAAMERCLSEGIGAAAFGDLYLEDVRAYRERNLAKVGMEARFPLWGADTAALAREFVSSGFEAVVTCVDTTLLDGAFAGRRFDDSFLDELPAGVDPCGENGEFHSFVYDGPIFSRPVACETGETVLRDGRFMFCDVIPGS